MLEIMLSKTTMRENSTTTSTHAHLSGCVSPATFAVALLLLAQHKLARQSSAGITTGPTVPREKLKDRTPAEFAVSVLLAHLVALRVSRRSHARDLVPLDFTARCALLCQPVVLPDDMAARLTLIRCETRPAQVFHGLAMMWRL